MLYAPTPSPCHGWNDELRMMNVESRPARLVREACPGRAGNLYAVNPSSDPRSPFVARDRPRLDDSFLDDLREFISLRLDRVDPYKESKEYCLQQEKAAHLYEKLRETLPEEDQAMLLQYGEALGAAHYLEVEILCEKAFMDGVTLMARAIGGGGRRCAGDNSKLNTHNS